MKAIKILQHYFEQATPHGWYNDCNTEIAGAVKDIIAEAVRQAVEKMQPATRPDTAVVELARQLAAANDEVAHWKSAAKAANEERIAANKQWRAQCDEMRRQRDTAWDVIDDMRHMLRIVTQSKTQGLTTYDAIRKHFTDEQTKLILTCLEEVEELDALSEYTPGSD